MILDGPRLRLRPWHDADAPTFATMNADPGVMRHFAAPLTREESDRFLAALMAHEAEHGFCFWAMERHAEPGAIGLCGLMRVPWGARFTPAVEIGWRVARAHWRQGFAEEAARLALAAGFGPLRLEEIVSFTVPANEPSWRLMAKLGMAPDGDFGHPRLAPEHPLHRHLLYRLGRAEWVRQRLG
ncbi:MAG: GNAT family N-acetyltransferase [Acetobacteraceae bacterium]|nr:GNAT family N-acetyltransferase [Acetobacteraceae bacterium]